MTALEARLDALTAAAPLAAGPPSAPDDVFWALNGLKHHLPEGDGAVLFTGVVPLPDGTGTAYEWQYGRRSEELFAEDWTELVGTLTALAHPVRLKLLREVIGGRHAAADLANAEGLGTTGQLYHHLRQLVAAGWLRMHGRGQYVVPGERVVPLLTILAAARH
jgi:hypothetical protein